MSNLRRKLLGMMKTQGSNIPDEYQEVTYIQSTGTQWIDTGINAISGTSGEIDFEFVEVPSDACVLGARTSSQRLYLMHCYPSMFCLGYGSYYSTNYLCRKDVRYKVKTLLHVAEQRMYLNDTEIFSRGQTPVIDLKLNYYLFGMNQSGSCAYRTKIKLYKCTISNRTQGLLAYYIPCYRKSDNVIGLYDVMTRTFLTNRGSGVFLKGADVNAS